MRKLISFVANLPHRLLAGAAAGVTVATSAKAEGIGAIASNVHDQLQDVGDLLVAGAFLAGIGLTGGGLFKLKQAADSQGQQVKYSEGIWRIVVGAGLAALPAVTGVGSGTIFGDGNISAPDMGEINIR